MQLKILTLTSVMKLKKMITNLRLMLVMMSWFPSTSLDFTSLHVLDQTTQELRDLIMSFGLLMMTVAMAAPTNVSLVNKSLMSGENKNLSASTENSLKEQP